MNSHFICHSNKCEYYNDSTLHVCLLCSLVYSKYIGDQMGTLFPPPGRIEPQFPCHPFVISANILVQSVSLLLYFGVINPYPTAFPYGNGMVLHFYQQQESSTTKTVHKVINKGLKAYV